MIPYNPSSFNSNKTILEQILELKRWLQAHPSYEVFYSSENGQSVAYTGYLLSSISDPTNLAVGDIVVFDNVTFGVVTSVDTDNGEFGCDPCISLAGPQGPTGPQGVSITNVSVDASNHLICTLSNGSSIDAGVIQYDTYITLTGNSGTLTDDEYAKVLLNDTKIIETIGTSTLIYTKYGESSSDISYTILVPLDVYPSPTTTTQNITINKSTHAWTKTAYKIPIGIDNIKSGAYSVNRCVKSDGDGASYWGFIEGTEVKSTGATSGQVLQADGSGGASWQTPSGGSVELEIAYADIGQALSDSDYAICLNADKMIVNYGAGQLIEYTRDTESSTDIKFARTYNSGVDVILVTKATKVVTNPTYKFIANSIDSQTATSGQVLQADGNGGASWQNAGGSQLYAHYLKFNRSSGGVTRKYDVVGCIITNTSTPFTQSSLLTYMNTNSISGIVAGGGYETTTGSGKYFSVYSILPVAGTIGFAWNEFDGTKGTFDPPSTYFSDTVITL